MACLPLVSWSSATLGTPRQSSTFFGIRWSPGSFTHNNKLLPHDGRTPMHQRKLCTPSSTHLKGPGLPSSTPDGAQINSRPPRPARSTIAPRVTSAAATRPSTAGTSTPPATPRRSPAAAKPCPGSACRAASSGSTRTSSSATARPSGTTPWSPNSPPGCRRRSRPPPFRPHGTGGIFGFTTAPHDWPHKRVVRTRTSGAWTGEPWGSPSIETSLP